MRRHFHKACFKTYWKEKNDEIVQIIKCKVSNNKIRYKGWRYNNENDIIEGEFIINPLNLKFGEGFHIHRTKNESTKSEKFGFDRIIIKDKNTFYVDSPYVKLMPKDKDNKKNICEQRYQAFVWRKE